jgi:hypothetical protein
MDHNTSTYADMLTSVKEILYVNDEYSHFIKLLDLTSESFIALFELNKHKYSTLDNLETKTQLKMIQHIKDKHFDEADKSFNTLKLIEMKKLELCEDGKIDVWNGNEKQKRDNGYYILSNNTKFQVDLMECLLHKAYSMELNNIKKLN